ncbi:hypothetical protein V5O48_010648 [Marasmius crinis-equi]|uniref:Uncharacterized protein n=1 Tax=Marasmius crinis-equi TaxID=585013 RepID=A0ABR3F8D8_9AGAR
MSSTGSTTNPFSVPQTFSDPFPSASPTPTRDPERPRGRDAAKPSAMYIYGFLAVLIILFAIAFLITFRSLRARRRYRRMVEEAIRNGTYDPPWEQGRRKQAVDLSRKPVMSEVWLGGSGYVESRPFVESDAGHPLEGKRKNGDGIAWQSIMPISLQSLKQSTDDDEDPNHPMGTSPSNPTMLDRFRSVPLLFISSPAPTANGSLPPSVINELPMFTYTPDTSPTANAKEETSLRTFPSKTMRVSFLVAMPSPEPFLALCKETDEEADLPCLEFGSIEVAVLGDTNRPSVGE